MRHDYAHLIGSDLRVGYSDQNESFASFMPLSGVVTEQLAFENGADDWLVLQLDEPLDYQTFSPQRGYRGHEVTHILIRSRWQNEPIGKRPTSVFVLLDIEHVLGTKTSYSANDFLHVCWGMVPPDARFDRGRESRG